MVRFGILVGSAGAWIHRRCFLGDGVSRSARFDCAFNGSLVTIVHPVTSLVVPTADMIATAKSHHVSRFIMKQQELQIGHELREETVSYHDLPKRSEWLRNHGIDITRMEVGKGNYLITYRIPNGQFWFGISET